MVALMRNLPRAYLGRSPQRAVCCRAASGSRSSYFPKDFLGALGSENDILELVLDVGRPPIARFLDNSSAPLADELMTQADIAAVLSILPPLDPKRRTGIEGALHRISVLHNREGLPIGLTCRVGRAPAAGVLPESVLDILRQGHSTLFIGKPGAGKTTALRHAAMALAACNKRVMVIDPSSEIGGFGNVPHPSLGQARRMHVCPGTSQHAAMIEAVQNHTPEVLVVDEIGTIDETRACRSVGERGVQLLATAHGITLEHILRNPSLADVVGGVVAVTLADTTAKSRGISRKTVMERKSWPTFAYVVEIREKDLFVIKETEKEVDSILQARQRQ